MGSVRDLGGLEKLVATQQHGYRKGITVWLRATHSIDEVGESLHVEWVSLEDRLGPRYPPQRGEWLQLRKAEGNAPVFLRETPRLLRLSSGLVRITTSIGSGSAMSTQSSCKLPTVAREKNMVEEIEGDLNHRINQAIN